MASEGERPELRVSDAERDTVAGLLRRHVAEGRLDLDEFSGRLDDVYGAKTNAELQAALRDLPALTQEGERSADETTRRARHAFRSHLVRYAIVNLFLVAIWLVTGAGHFWPAYPMLGWGMGLAFHAWNVYGGEADHDRDERGG